MTNDPSTRWRRRAPERPDEILDAALDEFVERGFDAARMEDIARRAGLSKAGVYLYFDSKEALLKALITREVSPIAARAQEIARAGAADPKATLRTLAAFAGARLQDPRLFAMPRLLISISNRFPDIAAFYKAEVIDRVRSALRDIIEAGIAQGVFRPVDPEVAVRVIAGPMIMEALLRHVFSDADAARAPADIVELALAALAPEPSP